MTAEEMSLCAMTHGILTVLSLSSSFAPSGMVSGHL